MRLPGIDAPTLRESGIPLDLANWRAIVAPPGLSDAEQDALIARITRLATSDAWRQALAQNGWDDLFLAGAGFRQFLLSEQARVGAVLQRLAAAEVAAPPRYTLSVTPTTMPTVTIAIFGLLAAALAAARARDRTPVGASGVAPRMAALLTIALLLQPVVMVTAGFIVSSTLLFAVTATAWRGVHPLTTVIAKDLVVGAVFTTLIYFIFSTGLGVSLP